MSQVVEESVAGDEMVMLRGCKNTRAVTVLLRGANDYMLDEMDRSLHDALSIVKRVLESGTVVAGEQMASATHFMCTGDRVRALLMCCRLFNSMDKRHAARSLSIITDSMSSLM